MVSEQVRHIPACTVTQDGKRLEILDLESRGIVLSMLRKQRRCEADLRLCFRICRVLVFPLGGLNILRIANLVIAVTLC